MFGGREKSALDKGIDAFNAKRWKQARAHLEDAANETPPRALGDYHLGLLQWRGLGGDQDQREAVKHFARAAESGHAAAQTALATALMTGTGVRQDENQARMLFRSAAGAGDVEAMTRLAAISEREEARRLLERAAELGHQPAMLHVSNLLIEDEPTAALAYLYACVALSGDEDACEHAEKLARELSATDIEAAQKSGRALLKKLKQERGRG